MEKENAHHYITQDLGEASLLYLSQKLVELREADNSGHFWFVFEDKTTCQRLVNSFWQREAVINARDFCDAMRTLKDLIFNKRRGKSNGYTRINNED